MGFEDNVPPPPIATLPSPLGYNPPLLATLETPQPHSSSGRPVRHRRSLSPAAVATMPPDLPTPRTRANTISSSNVDEGGLTLRGGPTVTGRILPLLHGCRHLGLRLGYPERSGATDGSIRSHTKENGKSVSLAAREGRFKESRSSEKPVVM